LAGAGTIGTTLVAPFITGKTAALLPSEEYRSRWVKALNSTGLTDDVRAVVSRHENAGRKLLSHSQLISLLSRHAGRANRALRS
jgi:hypothetical protein